MARAPVPTGRHTADEEPIYYLPERQPRAIIGGAAAAAIVVVVIIAAALIVAAVLSRTPAGQQAGPLGGTSGAATGLSASGPSLSPTLIVPTANTVSGIRSLMQQLVDTDNLDGDAQHDISRDLSDVLKDANRGRTDDARQRIGDIIDHLDDFRHDGKITDFGQQSLASALSAFAASLPTDNGGGDNQGGHG